MDTYRSYENFEKNCNSLADLLKKYPYTDGFFGSDLWAVVAVKTALKLGYNWVRWDNTFGDNNALYNYYLSTYR